MRTTYLSQQHEKCIKILAMFDKLQGKINFCTKCIDDIHKGKSNWTYKGFWQYEADILQYSSTYDRLKMYYQKELTKLLETAKKD